MCGKTPYTTFSLYHHINIMAHLKTWIFISRINHLSLDGSLTLGHLDFYRCLEAFFQENVPPFGHQRLPNYHPTRNRHASYEEQEIILRPVEVEIKTGTFNLFLEQTTKCWVCAITDVMATAVFLGSNTSDIVRTQILRSF